MTQVFRPRLNTFVREVLQNCHDQRVGGGAVSVRFTFRHLSGEAKARVLRAAGWEALAPHLEGASTAPSYVAQAISRALGALDGSPLVTLRIDDAGTRGLTGGEDERGENFCSLCKNVLDTSEDSVGRGGSYGLGKAVLWRFSALSTVFFSSRFSLEGQSRFRLFARSELPSHTASGTGWMGPGWYGGLQETAQGQRAVSAWDEDASSVAQEVGLFRSEDEGSGTSILLLGFADPGEEETIELDAIARNLLTSAGIYFWPSISRTPPTLAVRAEVYQDDALVFEDVADPEQAETSWYRSAWNAKTLVEKASQPNEVAAKSLPFRVPKRVAGHQDHGEEATDTDFDFRVVRPDSSADDNPLRNRVALVRGAGMVVDYRDAGRPVDGRPFFAVLRGGLARGDDHTDLALERFLRASEPPSHNEWSHDTDQIRVRYPVGARAQLQKLWADVRSAIIDLCDEPAARTDEGPPALAKLFPLGVAGPPTPGTDRFRVSFSEGRRDPGTGFWSTRGRVSRVQSVDSDWSITVTASLDGESGGGEPLLFRRFRVLDDSQLVGVRSTPTEVTCSVAQTLEALEFECELESGGPIAVTSRSRISVDVKPRNVGQGDTR